MLKLVFYAISASGQVDWHAKQRRRKVSKVCVLLVVMCVLLGRYLGWRYVRKRIGGLARKAAKALSEWGKCIAFL